MIRLKEYAGYISLNPINGVIFPSYIQNQMNKAFIENELSGKFYMSTNENMYSDNKIVLNSLILEKNRLSGITMLSAFSLPEKFKVRKKIYSNLIKTKKKIYFIFEKFGIENKKDIDFIEEYLMFRHNFFTKKKTSLTLEEKKNFIDSSWSFI